MARMDNDATTAPTLHAPQRFVVGYTADDRGAEALALAVTLAHQADAEIVITFVLPQPSPYSGAESGLYVNDPIVREQLLDWEAEALARIPSGIAARAELRVADSEAEGILAAVAEHGASTIVIGARSNPLLQAIAIGSTANALLHSAEVPVALAPVGYAHTGAVPRITAVYGTRPGGTAVVGTAVEAADRRGVPLRLLSLLPGGADAVSGELVDAARRFGGDALGSRADEILAGESGTTIEVVSGSDLEDAMTKVSWLDGEIALVGSSRLAPRGTVFIGSTAQRLMRRIPVPLIVIPRDYRPAPVAE
jgi:nucleotide-binding universal stress UspA family protein